jgi:NAD(P)-dependent dehydrogenase (short-subunit alcohol dehydrogenase family)
MSTSTTALIVGGTSGIGLATARQLLARGHDVHIAGRDRDRLAAVALSDPALHGHQADGSDGQAISSLASSLAPIDLLIVTAGGSEGIGPIAGLDLATLRRAFDAKFWAHVTTVQASLSFLAPQASITLIGAITAHASMPGTAGIAALSAAVEGLVRPLAVELAPIRVNAVSPGLVDTPWWSAIPEAGRLAYFESAAKSLPAGRIATADDVAEAVVLAATNPNITGTIIESDGGARLVTVG